MNKLRLGKRPPRIDKRTLRLRDIIKVELLPPIPDSFDVDQVLRVSPDLQMFANDQWGNCVIASRANHTLRFEDFEQRPATITITDQEVLDEYWKEQQFGCKLLQWLNPHPDRGLVYLDSLKAWRNSGWVVGGKTYNIFAFGAIDWLNHSELKACMYLLGGAQMGIKVPQSALDQFNAGQTWELVNRLSPIKGGHAIYLRGINSDLEPYCLSWAKIQPMTWEFLDYYGDECFGIVDNTDKWIDPAKDPVDVAKLKAYLDELAK